MCRSGLEVLICPFSTKLLSSTDLRIATSPAIATYTLLAAGFLSVRLCKALTVLSFRVIVCRLVCCVFPFLKGQEIY